MRLSNIVEEYLKSLAKIKVMETEEKLHPLIEELSGSIKYPDNIDYDDLIGYAKLEKYMKR